jgi:hypothetical protein
LVDGADSIAIFLRERLPSTQFEITLCALGCTFEANAIGFIHLVHKLQTPADQIGTEPLIKKLHITARKETTHHMRDGEVVLYLRPDSRVWQVRYKRYDRKWRCVSTRHRRLGVGKEGRCRNIRPS